MANRVHAYLRALGCRSVPAGGLRSCGQAFHVRQRAEAERESDRLYRERKAVLAAGQRAQQLADRERLRALGGVKRNAEQEREWRDLICRNTSINMRYFEERIWERGERAVNPANAPSATSAALHPA